MAARAPSPAEQDEIDSLLRPAERSLFWSQSAADQRHALEVARAVAAALPNDAVAVRAAILHDVGKRHARLGAAARSLATVFDAVGAALPSSWRQYRDHGRIGAAELAEAGAEALVVAFAGGHPGPPPPGIDPTVWQVLLDADNR